MALVCACSGEEGGKRFIATASGTKVAIAEQDDRQTAEDVNHVILNAASTPVSGECVVAMTTGCRGQLLAVCTSEKRLVVWECEEWRVKEERMVPKRVTALQISEDGQYLLTADKTGAVFRYRLSDVGHEGEELMGHQSMILDMVMVSHDSHVITCDRDEKIRVSRYPNCYNIETYCLGHTEFVSSLCLCKKWPHILISASGDGTVRSWDWRKGWLRYTYRISLDKENTPVAVTHLECSHNMDPSLVIATLEGATELVVLQLSSDGRLVRLPVEIALPVSPWSYTFDWSDRLWVCLPHKPHPVQCWKFEEGEWRRCSNALEKQLSNWDLFTDCGESRDWASLRKSTFDNMTDYLTRKEERIQRRTGTKPAMVNTRPVVVETKPAVVETIPAVVETEPAGVETEPVVVNTRPVVVNTRPVVVETKPAVVEAGPAGVETEPVVVDTRLAVVETKPAVVEDRSSMVETIQVVAEETKLVVNETKPVVVETIPAVVEDRSSMVETIQVVAEETKLVVNETKPVVVETIPAVVDTIPKMGEETTLAAIPAVVGIRPKVVKTIPEVAEGTRLASSKTKPIVDDTRPAVVTTIPEVVDGTRLVASETKPIAINTRPAVDDTRPAVVTTIPEVLKENRLLESETKPIAINTRPAEVDSEPTVVETRPAATKTRPTTVDTTLQPPPEKKQREM